MEGPAPDPARSFIVNESALLLQSLFTSSAPLAEVPKDYRSSAEADLDTVRTLSGKRGCGFPFEYRSFPVRVQAGD